LEHSKAKIGTEGAQDKFKEDVSFLTLLESLLDSLSDFTSPDENKSQVSQLIDQQQEIVFSKQIKMRIDLPTLYFVHRVHNDKCKKMSTSNASRKETERTKLMQDKCQTLLTQMLRDDDNKYCVDCDAKGKYTHANRTYLHIHINLCMCN